MKYIRENVVFAKSILKKQNILPDSEEYKDYLKIRELCGDNHGYVGIITKLRFIDNVTDFDELANILEVLKNSKKLNKYSYDEILDIFYDELSGDKKTKDYELIFKDNTYSYYKVYTYEGILQIGSPSWCLKTKTNWDSYKEKYTDQWVVIYNTMKNKLINPNNNYLSQYKPNKSFYRFGISMKDDNYLAFNDSNEKVSHKSNHTLFGVIYTIVNLDKGIMKSYYDNFPTCTKTNTQWSKSNDEIFRILDIKTGKYKNKPDIFVLLDNRYSNWPVIMSLSDIDIKCIFYNRINYETEYMEFGPVSSSLILDKAKTSKSNLYLGLKYKLGLVTLDDIKSNVNFIKIIDDKWLVLNHNGNDKDYLLVINLKAPDKIQVALELKDKKLQNMNDPLYFYLDKDNNDAFYISNKQLTSYIFDNLVEPNNKKTIMKGFWDFLKKKD